MSSFDDESTLWDPTSPTEKEKPKSKLGRSPKRMVRGLVEVSPKKSPKKDKKDKKDKSKNKNHDDLEKFIPYEDRNDEKSEEWLEFEAMQARIKANVAKTQERLSRLGSSGEKLISAGNGDNDNAACGNVNSAWIAFDENGEPVNNVFDNDKAEGGWQGFDDDFNGGSKTSKSQLGVSPGASPRHTPVPPNNSRRQSIEDKSDVDKGRETEADLLGLMADSSNTGQTQSAPTSSLNTDLLGLDGMSGAEQISGDVDMLGGISLLSRNPPASNMSSTAPSPAPGRRDLFDDLKGEGSDTEQTSSGAMQLVDDFLGITAAVDTSSNKEPSLPTQTDAEVPQTKLGADIFNIDSRTPENLDTVDDDDFLGLGIQTKRTSSSTNVIPGGNLMEGFEDETKDDTEQAPATLTEPKAPSPIPSPNRSRPRPKGKAVVDLSSIVQKLSGPQEQETTSVPTKPTDIVPDLFGTDDAVTVTVEQPQTEAKPLDEDLFGLGPSADGDVGEGELTQPPGDPFDILAQTSDTNPFTKSDTEVPTKATPDVLEVFLGGSAEKAETPMSDDFDPRGDFKLSSRPPADSGVADVWGDSAAGSSEFEADFTAVPEGAASKNPFADFDGQQGAAGASVNPFEVSGTAQPELFGVDGPINPFATVTKDAPGPEDPDFDPFATITEDDQAFEASITAGRPSSGSPSSDREDGEPKSPRINPFNKEPPLDDKFANFEAQVKKESESASPPQLPSVQSSVDDEPEDLEPSEPFYPEYTGDGWKLLLRMPLKKKFTGNRFWKPVYIRICKQGDNNFVLKIFHNEKDSEAFHELALQASYNMCNMGLQQFDQFGKCHTVKIQYVFYRETVGMKTERITPTLNDLMRVRNIKGLKDLVHKPKTTMILDHAPQASELLKIGGLSLEDFRIFVRELENAFFHMKVHREKTLTYTKDEMTMDVVDEYYAEIDKFGHIVDHKNRVRVFCLAFLTGMPLCELGLNDKRRRGKEIVGRHDIIPIKTEEWIRIETPEFHCTVDSEDYEKSKLVKFKPLDGAQFELLRFRTRPKANKELPLQIRSQMSVVDKHVEIRADVMIPGYFSNSRRAAQVPCEDIEICFPVPEQWIYLFRVEKRFRYGSIKAATRKPGKIKGLERLTMIAQGILPPSLIEVSAGTAKYENVYKGIVWRISRLPERNEGAYKTHLFVCKLDLGPHDVVPDTYEQHVKVTFSMPNSTVSRAQVRSISVDNPDPPDKWVHHLAKYEYKVEIEFTDQLAKFQESDLVVTSPKSPLATEPQDGMPEEEPDQPPEGAVAKLIDADDSDSSFDSD